ncbi:2OG-Fe dioxygenase family protein [Facilibium subflavum]|uniref:2OG-Fe dioxygenase family protein n=1 Tax=Facilibium subflavum TaxID=2219058 RepID=UPI000E65013C|nr:2OG-Fe dioxygenase family protein [Facilibium subflavum]
MYFVKEVSQLPNAIKQSFLDLKRDPNMKQGDNYRYRAFSVGDVNNNKVSVSPHGEVFHQSQKLNKYQGGIDRHFPLIEMPVAQYVADNIIRSHIYPLIPKGNYHFGIHQIRIETTDEITGKPAPEGIHQDGFDYVCVLCANLNNVSGGNSVLVDVKDRSHILFDDKKYAHYASAIVPVIPGKGWRDVFVITLQKAKKQ